MSATTRRGPAPRPALAACLSLGLALVSTRAAADEDDGDRGGVEVLVQGEALLPRAAADPTAATTVLDGEALRVPGQSTAEALARAPGVQIARSGATSELATASLRGATTAQTPIYLSGVRLNDDITGTADLATVPLFWLRRAEVWRGASPAWVDRPGLAGAILLEPELPRRSRVGASVGIGSFGQRFAWLGGSVGNRRAAAAFALRGEAATNDTTYVDDAGTRFDAGDDVLRERANADVRSGDAWALGRVTTGNRGELTMILNGFLREQGVTGLGVVPATRARATTRRELMATTSRTRCGEIALDEGCVVELRFHALRTAYELTDPLRELGFGTDLQVTRGSRYGQDARLVLRPLEPLSLDIGAGASFERIDVAPRDLTDVTARRTATRAHLEATWTPTPAVEVRAGGMFSFDATRGGDAGASELLAPMARLAAQITVTPWLSFFASTARTVRVPTLGETFGASAVLRGNPALREERGVSGEGGARLTAGEPADPVRASLEVLGFARFADDLVAYRRTSLGGVRPFNVGRARILGGEVSAAADVLHHLRADLALTALDPRDLEVADAERDLLPHQARLVVAPSLTLYADDPFEALAVDHAALVARLLFRGERVADPAGLIVLPAQTWLDLEAIVSFAEERLALRARLANVLDDQATDTLGLPLPGRSAHVAAEVWWN